MKKLMLCLAAWLMAGMATSAFADPITIDHPWARATMANSATGAAYAKLTNPGTTPDHLIGISTDVAAKAELHQSLNEDGVMKMKPVPILELKPGETVELKPGGYHIMLTGLKQPLVAGQSFPVTLEFEKAGKQQVTVTIEAMQMGHDMKDMPGMSH